VSIQDPNVVVGDTAYLKMSDEDIKLYLKIVMTRDFPKVPSLELLPNESVYPVVLLAKKELYFALASADAPLTDIGADNNNYLKRSQRFEHYMKLVGEVNEEYNQYNKDGGQNNRLTSYDVLLSNRFYTNRNRDLGLVPELAVSVMSLLSTTVELTWEVTISRFLNYRVYLSTRPILDEYDLGEKISENAVLIATITNQLQKKCRIEGLDPLTTYYVLISATDRSSLTGYKEIQITTVGA
jgi:hypothetical protein